MIFWATNGSSPLTRGKLHGRHPVRVRQRLIPAHAGKTANSPDSRPARPAHPRSRGENFAGLKGKVSSAGSSPLTRGKPEAVEVRTLRRGLIPAHAGKTRSCKSCLIVSTAHPRSRGENHPVPGTTFWYRGSSPLTRGKRYRGETTGGGGGLIPAHAGKTCCRGYANFGRGAHPRSRGENQASSAILPNTPGSSPLTRGKPDPVHGATHVRRLIPAHAGKTQAARVAA